MTIIFGGIINVEFNQQFGKKRYNKNAARV